MNFIDRGKKYSVVTRHTGKAGAERTAWAPPSPGDSHAARGPEGTPMSFGVSGCP